MKKFIAGIFLLSILFSSCKEHKLVYQFSEGQIFGTSYHITYQFPENKELKTGFVSLMNEFNESMSTYIPGSIISRINSNDPDVEPDAYFRNVFNRAQQISALTGGAFDMTVAPLVNAYGFGFTKREVISEARIKELLEITGYHKIRIEGRKIVKDDPRVMLDASAIAKGYGVDLVAMFLEENGVNNYLVEIGGELRCKGANPKGEDWKVGIDKPIENMIERDIQVVLNLSDISLATSGNYRQFIEEDGIKYSHTIDPSTGKPVTHNLLSATVLAADCMTADAFATAFMVLGLDKSLEIVNSDPEIEGYFIYASEDGSFKTTYSKGLESILNDKYQ